MFGRRYELPLAETVVFYNTTLLILQNIFYSYMERKIVFAIRFRMFFVSGF